MGAMMTSQIIITDRKDGIWDRSVVAGITSLEITLTHFILQAGIMLVQTTEVVILIFVIYGYTYEGSVLLIFIISLLSGICGMVYGLLGLIYFFQVTFKGSFIGFWVSVLCEDHSQANISVSGGFLPMMLLCGKLYPL